MRDHRADKDSSTHLLLPVLAGFRTGLIEQCVQKEAVQSALMLQNALYPSDSSTIEDFGESAAELLDIARESKWLLRRKEKAVLLDDSVIRRQMSIDFVLPESVCPKAKLASQKVWYAPLFFLPKGLDEPFDPHAPLGPPEPFLANFDLRDRHGQALSLPSRAWNGRVTTEMLRTIIEGSLDEQGFDTSGLKDGIRGFASKLCTSDHRSAALILETLREQQHSGNGSDSLKRAIVLADSGDERLARMLEVCSGASVTMIPLIGPGCRQGIVKLSFDEEVTSVTSGAQPWQKALARIGWGGYELWAETPYIGASSYHFEFEAPDGLEIYDSGLVRVDGPEPTSKTLRPETMLDRVSGYSSRLHLYEPDASGALKSFAWVRLRVRRQEFVGGAAIAGLVVAVAMWGAYFVAGDAALTPTAIPTLMLLVPSVIAAYAVRPSPHRLTTKMLAPARWIVASSATIPFIAAGILALAQRDEDSGEVINRAFEGWWLGGAILATVLALVLLGTRSFPIPELKARKWKGWVHQNFSLYDRNRLRLLASWFNHLPLGKLRVVLKRRKGR